jgi:acyl-CoA reductase-like NAD-dependent aldehyde dehydrogenase
VTPIPIATVNPATGGTVRTFEPHDAAEVERRISQAAGVAAVLHSASFTQRAAWMNAAADVIESDTVSLARLLTLEMGKPTAQAAAEVAKCAHGMRFYARNAEAFLADEPLDDPASVGAAKAWTVWQPLGVVLAVMPWNFPPWQVMRFAAPALMAGNAGLLKHASNVPQAALYLDTLFERGGFPPAAKRFIVHADVYDEFARQFADKTAKLVVGDPADEATDVGPLATASGRDDLAELVDDAVAKGAQVLVGGSASSRPGWYYPPTVLAGLTADMRIVWEEAFGPVASLYRVADRAEAARMANQTTFGLSSAVWSGDAAEQEWFVRNLEAGMVFLNGMSQSFPELPFGGVKNSGYGRKLTRSGIGEFCNLKTIWKS